MATKYPTVATKAVNVSTSVSPKMRYGLELLSRKQHRNISEIVLCAIKSLMVDPIEGLVDEQGVSILDNVWELDELDRLVKLADFYPHLLSYEEECVVKSLRKPTR